MKKMEVTHIHVEIPRSAEYLLIHRRVTSANVIIWQMTTFCAIKESLKFCSVDYMVIIQKLTLEELLLISIENIKKYS